MNITSFIILIISAVLATDHYIVKNEKINILKWILCIYYINLNLTNLDIKNLKLLST